MAVPEQTPYKEYTANGITKIFPLEFDVLEQDHLIVLVNDLEPSVGSWSLDALNDTVVFALPPASGANIKIRRDTPMARSTDYQTYNNSFRPEPVNKDLDNIWRKLQEMGVLNWMIDNNIKDLGDYVDGLNEETKAQFLAEIQKQGVSMQQLDIYVSGLYQKLANTAVEKGWLAAFISDKNGLNQQQINDYQILINKKISTQVSSIAEMIAIEEPYDGQVVNTISYYQGLSKGGNRYFYDSTKKNTTNGGTVIYGWVGLNTTDDAYQWGAKQDADFDDTNAVIRCLTVMKSVLLSDMPKLGRIGLDANWIVRGKASITYTRRPNLPCELDTYKLQDKSKMKAVYVWGLWDLCELLQVKTAGFNTIIHYRYTFTDNGTTEKAVNACQAIDLNIVLNSQNDIPPVLDINLGQQFTCVIGYYLFDEPQYHNIPISIQDTRIANWKAVTSKKLFTVDHGIHGFTNNGIANGYDVVFADIYHISNQTDEFNKMAGVIGFSELVYKCSNAKIIPCVGLFVGDGSDNVSKNINFGKDLYRCGQGDYLAFGWDASSSDLRLGDIISNNALYDAAKYFNFLPPHEPYKFDVYVYGQLTGLNKLLTIYDSNYSSSNTKPYTVVNSGSAIDDRHQAFANRGIGVANDGGRFAFNFRSLGYIATSTFFYNHIDASTAMITPFQTADDFFTFYNFPTKTLSNTQGFTEGYTINVGQSFGFSIIPNIANQFFFKFVSGSIVNSSWINAEF